MNILPQLCVNAKTKRFILRYFSHTSTHFLDENERVTYTQNKRTKEGVFLKTIRNWPKRLFIIVLGLFLLCACGFAVYVANYYHADTSALAILEKDHVAVSADDDLITLTPDETSDTAILFYPGAKVEAEAYLPLLDQLRNAGYTCFLAEMPFNMAIFDSDAAADIITAHPDIHHWYLAGHSMGGAMASSYAADHPDELDGLILLGAYLYGDYPTADTLTIYGSLNTSVAEEVDYSENVVVIDGGNHAQFGNYGPQKGDPAASISADEQQAQTVTAICDFITGRAA